MAEPKRERHRGVYIHGEETRRTLLETAIDLFGLHGFDAVGTRRIAEDADVNISAISYYFGSKEGLLVAAAKHLASQLCERLAPVFEDVRQALDDPDLTPERARDAFLAVLDAVCDIIIPESEETERWARFIARQEVEGGPGLEALGFRDRHTAEPALIARIRGTAPDDVDNKIRAEAIFGQVLTFRSSRASILAAMGKTRLSDADVARIKGVIREHAIAALSPAPGGAAGQAGG